MPNVCHKVKRMSKKKNHVLSDTAVVMLVSLGALYLCGMLTSWVENMPLLGMFGVALAISVIYSVVQLVRRIPVQPDGSENV